MSEDPHEGREVRSTLRHVSAAQGGETQAWERLTAKIWEEVSRRIRANQLPPTWELQDLAQLVNVAAFQSIASFKSVDADSFRRWVGTIVSHRLTDLWRRARADKRKEDVAAIRLGADLEASDAGAIQIEDDPALQPLHLLELKESEERMREVEDKLSERHRRILRLREQEGLEYAEIADEMELPGKDAARYLYSHARRRREEEMKSYYETHCV